MFFPFDVSPLNQCYFCRHPAADTQSGRVFVRVMPQTALGSLPRRCRCYEIRRKVSFLPLSGPLPFITITEENPGEKVRVGVLLLVGVGAGAAEVYMTLSRVMPLRRVLQPYR